MIEYVVLTPSLLKLDNDEIDQSKPVFIEVARYDYDLGLQLNEKITLEDVRYGDETFSFTGAVVDIVKTVKQKIGKVHNKDNDIFRIDVIVEIDDKEHMQEIRDILMGLNPGKFKE
jgi:hypothetical protein